MASLCTIYRVHLQRHMSGVGSWDGITDFRSRKLRILFCLLTIEVICTVVRKPRIRAYAAQNIDRPSLHLQPPLTQKRPNYAALYLTRPMPTPNADPRPDNAM